MQIGSKYSENYLIEQNIIKLIIKYKIITGDLENINKIKMNEMNEQNNNKIFETNSSSQNILNNFGKIPSSKSSYNLEK